MPMKPIGAQKLKKSCESLEVMLVQPSEQDVAPASLTVPGIESLPVDRKVVVSLLSLLVGMASNNPSPDVHYLAVRQAEGVAEKWGVSSAEFYSTVSKWLNLQEKLRKSNYMSGMF